MILTTNVVYLKILGAALQISKSRIQKTDLRRIWEGHWPVTIVLGSPQWVKEGVTPMVSMHLGEVMLHFF